MPSFLSPLLDAAADGFELRHARTGAVVARRLLPAFDSRARRTGLLAHATMDPDTAMIIPTSAIHTWFMRFPIDVAFVARDGRIVKTREPLRAWRMSAALGAFAVVELAAGVLERAGARPGDYLVVVARES